MHVYFHIAIISRSSEPSEEICEVILSETLQQKRYFLRKFFSINFYFVKVMDMSVVHSVENKLRLSLKVTFVKPSEGNPSSALSIIPNNVICLEDVKNYLNNKFETISSELISRDMDIVFNQDMKMKPKFEHLRNLDLVKYHFYQDLDVREWTQIILS